MVNILKVLYYLRFANRRLHWDKEKLAQYQSERLRSVVRYADQYVPFYHKRFKEFGVDVASIRKIEDLSKLPVIKKDEFKRQDPTQTVSPQYDLNRLKKVRTSGSTGTPFEVYITPNEDAWRKATYMRANINCGQKPRDRWVVLTSPTHFGDTTSLQRKIGIYAQNCISLFESTDSKISQIEAARPDILDGYSGSLVLLAKEIQRRGLTSIRPRLMFGNAELISLESRHFVEEAFGAPYCDQFGCAEVDRSAWQCLERGGYHMDVDSVVTEFLDGAGDPVNVGERGEVTYTSLFNFAMPLIRYAIGDVGVPSGDMCACGVGFPLMEVVEGRKDSFLTLPNNRIVSPMVFNFAVSRFKFYRVIDQYLIRQRAIDHFEVSLKIVDSPIDRDFLKREFIKHVTAFLDVSDSNVIFDVSFVDEIPLSKTGKLLSVVSDLKGPLF